MKRKSFTICLVYLGVMIISFSALNGQQVSKAQITNIDFNLVEGKIVITYDIIRFRKGEKFLVYANAVTESGDTIRARSVTGDVNDNITGGNRKMITWDYQRDNFFTSEGFHIEINALSQTVEIPPGAPGDYPGLGISLLQSTVFPGWGSTRLTDGKPHWIKGIAGYGSLALSYVYNQKAVSSYEKYLPLMDATIRKQYFDDALSQKQLSTVFGVAAIATWALDYACVIITHNRMGRHAYAGITQKMSFGYDFDPAFPGPLLSVRFTF